MSPVIVMQFDLKRAPFCPDGMADRYRACIDMVRWADKQAITVVGFSEHHNTDNGFLSSPLRMDARTLPTLTCTPVKRGPTRSMPFLMTVSM